MLCCHTLLAVLGHVYTLHGHSHAMTTLNVMLHDSGSQPVRFRACHRADRCVRRVARPVTMGGVDNPTCLCRHYPVMVESQASSEDIDDMSIARPLLPREDAHSIHGDSELATVVRSVSAM
ncbi:hypothetical protein PAXRUDRAFT_310531 [Paxillus rubicundulus Ve08.2h10]|uniref:Secreted protein n=1 Tax=Paxillus rubicundulus Ve08.2h10 TaxID=930991 RepID=A0A0D0DSI0_9AGAM|nr:hypothetical protein PAXRUDRAFT_310531 [Paxillus rubicundulus Ve08.2h10]